MVSANSFTFNGVSSASYGLELASFNSSEVEDHELPQLSVATIAALRGAKFYYAGATIGSAPTIEFSAVRSNGSPLSLSERESIYGWLRTTSGYKTLSFTSVLDTDTIRLDTHQYNAIISNFNFISVNGYIVGVHVTAQLESQYANIGTTTRNISAGSNTCNVTGNYDGYTYPLITITTTGANAKISLTNTSDTGYSHRVFTAEHMPSGMTLTIDGEKRIITGTGSTNYLSYITGKYWLRLLNGANTISATNMSNVTCTLKYPNYSCIGF